MTYEFAVDKIPSLERVATRLKKIVAGKVGIKRRGKDEFIIATTSSTSEKFINLLREVHNIETPEDEFADDAIKNHVTIVVKNGKNKHLVSWGFLVPLLNMEDKKARRKRTVTNNNVESLTTYVLRQADKVVGIALYDGRNAKHGKIFFANETVDIQVSTHDAENYGDASAQNYDGTRPVYVVKVRGEKFVFHSLKWMIENQILSSLEFNPLNEDHPLLAIAQFS